MKKILGLTIAALLVMALVGGGSWAYFSDVEVSTGNVLSAGTLDLTVNGGNSDVVMFTLGNKLPGDSGLGASAGYLTLKNVGDTAGDLKFEITANTNTESTGTEGTADATSTDILMVDAALVEADDFWIGHTLTFLTGAANDGESRLVTDFDNATYTITVASAFTSTIGVGDDYALHTQYERIGSGELGAEVDIAIWIDMDGSGVTYVATTDRRIDADGTTYQTGSLEFEPIDTYGTKTWMGAVSGLAAGSTVTLYVEWNFVNELFSQNTAQGDSVELDFEFELTQ